MHALVPLAEHCKWEVLVDGELLDSLPSYLEEGKLTGDDAGEEGEGARRAHVDVARINTAVACDGEISGRRGETRGGKLRWRYSGGMAADIKGRREGRRAGMEGERNRGM